MSSLQQSFESVRRVDDDRTLLTALPALHPLKVIVVSGALTIPSTTAAQPNVAPEAAFVPDLDSTTSTPVWASAPVDAETQAAASERTRCAVSELRRLSGLTWDQLAQVFAVSRRSLHFWASGKPLSASNEALLLQVLDVVRAVDRGDARSTRSVLLEPVGGTRPYDLLVEQRFDELRDLLGEAGPKRRLMLPPLEAAATEARKPLPPEELFGARSERVHTEEPRSRAARTARNRGRGHR